MPMQNDNPYLKRLEDLGYKSHTSHEPLYKYTSAEVFKLILQNNTLKYSNPLTFNDPFEFSDDCFDYEISDEAFRKLLEYNASFAPPEVQQQFLQDDTIAKFPKDLFVGVNKNRIEYQKLNSLVLCTSMSPVVPLMWSHYANMHTGICFGIKIPTDSENENEMMITKSVVYGSEIRPHNLFTMDNIVIMEGVYNWVYSKSKVWDYELEMRTFISRRFDNNFRNNICITKGPEFEYRPFGKETLVEVHYGLRTSKADIVEIERIIQDFGYTHAIKRYKIEKVQGTYNIERKLL